jgi:hypothetical protein
MTTEAVSRLCPRRMAGMPQSSTWRLPWRKSRMTTARFLGFTVAGLPLRSSTMCPARTPFLEAIAEPAAGLDEV